MILTLILTLTLTLSLAPTRCDRCTAWVNKPAIRFSISNHENFFHYLNDALMLVLDTLNDTGLTPPSVKRREPVPGAPRTSTL